MDPAIRQGAEAVVIALGERPDLRGLPPDDPRMQAAVQAAVAQYLREHHSALPVPERERICEELIREFVGYGPIDRLLRDPDVVEIMVNGPGAVYTERVSGAIEREPEQFQDEKHLREIISRVTTPAGRRVNDAEPIVDARLPDGSRVNAVLRPTAVKGSALTIRKFRPLLTAQALVAGGTLTPELHDFLGLCVRARLNILVSGGTSSGKTTLLNCLSGFISAQERIITIEDAAELQLQQPHAVGLEARPPNMEGRGEITIRSLVRTALRMRPDRIVVGEVRGPEALDMIQAMNTGHDGCLSTVHANSARAALMRVATLAAMAEERLSEGSLLRQIVDAIHLVVHVQRQSGRRRVAEVVEILDVQAGVFETQPLFALHKGQIQQTGVAPGRIAAMLQERGLFPAGERGESR